MNSNDEIYSHMRNLMGRKRLGRVNFCLRVDKYLLERLKEISRATGKPIADLIEMKVVELIALYEKGSLTPGQGFEPWRANAQWISSPPQ